MSSRPFFCAIAAFLLSANLVPSADATVSDDQDHVAEPITSTVAGSGLRGITDGPASSATFLTPTGVAIGNAGTVYVADVAAQNIRRIRDGVVDTYAGITEASESPEARVGGYVDGSVSVAKFDRPIALAWHAGDLFVADAGNHCIRKISSGAVATIARNFVDLKGIAVADNGELFIADDGVGIRRIERDGRLSTLALPSDRKIVLGVAVRSFGARQYLAYTDTTHVYLKGPGTARVQSLAYDDEREPDAAGIGVGHAYGIALLNENTVVVTDTTTHAVRLIRFPAPPFVAGRVVRALAGGISEGFDTAGGFEDGPSTRSRLDTPTAVAVASDGTLFVADAGNRRVRKITGVDARESVLPDLSNFAIPDHSYHIAVVGNSYAFYNVLWPESIGGRIEAGLARDAESIGLTQHPSVTTFRIDAASDDAAISVIHEYLFDHRTSLIVLMLNNYVAMRTSTLDRLKYQLDSVGIKLLVVYTPQGFQISPRDYFSQNRDTGETDLVKLRTQAAKDESYYNMTSPHGLYLLNAVEAQEALKNRQPLFYSSEHHLTIYGSEWVGRRILDDLEQWKPWHRDSTRS